MEASAPLRRPWVLCGVVLVSAVIFLRMLLNFRHALPPATDGAYYPMQTWWLIEHGRLMYDDLPLFFWLNAVLARVIMAFSQMSLEDAAVLASRLIDVTAQPWVAICILALGYVWSSGRREALLGCGSAAVLAVFSPPVMRMMSDFQKNSLGLVWMACALVAMRWALAEPRRILRWVVLAVVILLAGLTHIGAFGVTCIMLVTAGVVYCLSGRTSLLTKRGVAWLLVGAGLGGVMLAVVWWFEPTRTAALLTAPWRLVNVGNFRHSPAILAVVVAYALLGFFLRWLWRNRAAIKRCDRALAAGVAAAIAVLVFPFFPQDYTSRFLIMTPLPAAVLLTLVLAHQVAAGHVHARRSAKIVAAVALLLAIPSPLMMQGSPLSVDEAQEIRSMSDSIPDPTHTLIVAPHGLQYWAGLLLHTPVRMGQVPEDAFTRYTRVLMLEQTASSRRQPPLRRDDRRGGAGQGQRLDDGRDPQRQSQRQSQTPPQRPPGQRTLVIPADAVLVGQTSSFKLYEIKEPAGR